MRSCSSPVLVKQATKEVASAPPGSPSLADQGHSGGWTRRFQPKRSVWSVPVVVLDIDPEGLLQVTTADDQQPVEALGAHRPDPALRMSVRVGGPHRRQEHLGALGAEQIIERAAELRVAVAQHKAQPSSSFAECHQQVRACWVTQAPFGWAVTPARWTRRVANSMKNSTYSRCSHTVSTVKKSQATISAACPAARRAGRHARRPRLRAGRAAGRVNAAAAQLGTT
jgi:hypothetical protein